MSSEALAWAFRLNIKPSSLKFTLVALCECANYKTGRVMPSVAHLCEITGLDRKTVLSNVAKLEALGLLQDTGKKTGRTGQIKVYEINHNGAENGTVKQSQKRDTIPKTAPLKSTVFPSKESQKRDTEPSREPSLKKKIPKKNDEVSKPDGVSDQTWKDFKAHRKRKSADITATAMVGITNEAKKAGWSLENALIEIVTRNWQGFKADWVDKKPAANDSGGFLQNFQKRQAGGP